jgi:acetyl esterase
VKLQRLLLQARRVAGGPVARALLACGPVRRRLARSRSQPVDGARLDEHLAAMLALDELSGGASGFDGLTPAEARAALRDSVAAVAPAPPRGVARADLTLRGPAGPLPARAYTPPGAPAVTPGLLFFHGGGWVTGDLDTHDPFCCQLAAEAGIRVVAVDYRLGPEHPFPAAVDDALAAFRQLAAEAGQHGLDPARLGVGGDSAGGNLAAVVARKTRGDARPPALAALLYPGLDATRALPSHRVFAERYFLTAAMIEWYLARYLGGDESRRRHPDMSPLLADDPAGLGRHLVVVAHFDPLRDEGLAYADKLSAAGVSVRTRRFAEQMHGFILIGGAAPAADAATRSVIADIGAGLRGSW